MAYVYICCFQTGTFKPLVTCLTDEEEEAMRNMLRRIDTIAKVGWVSS